MFYTMMNKIIEPFPVSLNQAIRIRKALIECARPYLDRIGSFRSRYGLVYMAILLSSPSLAADTIVTQTTKCRMITRHVPDADVAYRPGQDVVAGKPVAPADLPADLDGAAPQITAPQNFAIEIDAVLPGTGPAAIQPRAKIGRVEVSDLGGETTLGFNGQKLYQGAPQTASPECAE